MQEYNEVFRTVAGSRLYGTNLPSSDMDYKSVRIPTADEILLGKVKQTVNTSTGDKNSSNTLDDVDNEIFTVQRFLELASQMQPVAVELLFSKPTLSSKVWQEIVDNKDKILNKNSGPFMGYCRAQANRYSVRGGRIEAFTSIVDEFRKYDSKMKACEIAPLISDLYKLTSTYEDIVVTHKPNPGGKLIPTLEVYGRQAALTCTVGDVLKVMEKPLKEAGKRSMEAYEAGGADWKAMYHAVRISQQGIDIFTEGEMTFPRPEKDLLLSIRQGEKTLDEVMDIFDSNMIKLEDAVRCTKLPDSPDTEWIDSLVKRVYKEQITDKM